ncbi:hypothetical protein GCM10020229_46730 [Kitasatospora albolonga]
MELVGDQRVMLDRPSQLPAELVAASAGRRLVLHAMHSVVDWLAFAVWEDGRLVRSLGLSPDGGIIEDIGERLSFEHPFWAGEHPVERLRIADAPERAYPLTFHPLELGEEALRALCGFVMEGRPEPGDLDPDDIHLHGFRRQDPQAPDRAALEAAIRARVAAMPPPKTYVMGPDGTLVERPLP